MAQAASRILVWGGGGHGKVVADVARRLGHAIVGFADSDPNKLGSVVESGGGEVTILEEHLEQLITSSRIYPDGVDAVALAIGNNARRFDCLERLRGLPVATLIHPSASVSPSARIGDGTAVFPGAVINADARIGEAAIINSAAVVEHDCVIGAAAHVSPGAVLTGGVQIGDRSWIGAGAVILPGVGIGADSVVGAGAVVLREVPAGVVVVGNPARLVR